MAFEKKTWKNRISEFANRRKLIDTTTNDEQIVTVARYEGEITQEGDAFSAENMNNLETRIDEALADIESDFNAILNTRFSSLARVATSGSYADLSNKPTIPAAQIQSNWNETNTSSKAYIQNKPTIPAAVAVKGNAETTYRTGNVNLTPANIGAATSNHVHGQITNDGKVTTNVAMANGDAFLIADASASNLVKQGLLFWSGSLSAYNAISSKNSNTIYFITE